ncbi:MAG TPA: copper chaperone PCu(A)C [Stellaceae bacterium]|jgi:copper(I)-binding protein|nr:copper chaperone PCu(A)C [Stellaceae bacterium]
MRRRDLLLAPFLLLAPRPVAAHSYALGPIEVGHPWARPSITGAAAVFMALGNTGKSSDRLIAAMSPIAEQVFLRAEDGSEVEYYELLPRRPVALRPGGKYIGLRGVKGLLALEDSFPMTLRFAAAGDMEVTVTVEDGPEGY